MLSRIALRNVGLIRNRAPLVAKRLCTSSNNKKIEKSIDTSDIIVFGVICSGVAGSIIFPYCNYNGTRYESFSKTIVLTNFNVAIGFCFGIVCFVFSPIVIPTTCAIALMRYNDKELEGKFWKGKSYTE